MSDLALGRRLMDRLEALSRFSDDAEGLTRLYLSPSHRRAADAVAGWMRDAGMDVRMDALGTLIGRYAGSANNNRALVVGSHIDTVRNAGRYDGCLGVVLAIEAMAELQRLGRKLPYAVEVLAFGDEAAACMMDKLGQDFVDEAMAAGLSGADPTADTAFLENMITATSSCGVN